MQTLSPLAESGASADGKTISVMLEELPQLASNVHQLGSDCGALPLPLGGISAQLMLFLGVSEHGRQASASAASAAATLGERALKLEATATAVDACTRGYHRAEEAAKGLFAKIGLSEDGKMPNGMSEEEWMRNALAHPQSAFNDLWSWEKYELGYEGARGIFGWGMRSGNPYIMGITALSAVAMFGATAYLDMRANPDLARRRIIRKLEKSGVPHDQAVRVANGLASWFGRKKNQGKQPLGGIAGWYKDGAQTLDRMPITEANIAAAMDEAAKNKSPQNHEGAVSQGYAGIEVHVYRDPKTGHRVVQAYIPGTDFWSLMGKQGDPSGLPGALRIAAETPENPLKDSHIMMRALDEALKAQGVTSDDDVILIGHSQGAGIAYNAANNNEFASRYHVTDVYSFGGPIQALPGRGNKTFRVHQVKDKGDPVPAIITGPTWQERPGDSTIITDRRSLHLGGDPSPHEMTHDMRFYREALARNADAQKPMAASPQGDYSYEGGNMYSFTSNSANPFMDTAEAGTATLKNGRSVNPAVLGHMGADKIENTARSWTPDFLKPSLDAWDPRNPVDYTDPKISGLPAPVENSGTLENSGTVENSSTIKPRGGGIQEAMNKFEQPLRQHVPTSSNAQSRVWHAPELLNQVPESQDLLYHPANASPTGAIPQGAGSEAAPYYRPTQPGLLDGLPTLEGTAGAAPNPTPGTQEGYLPPLTDILGQSTGDSPQLNPPEFHPPQHHLQPDGETVIPDDIGDRMRTNPPSTNQRTLHNPRLLAAAA